MVDALIRAGRWIAPPLGCIIDLRPAHVVPDVELGLGGGAVVRVGGLVVEDERRARHAAADAAVREAVARRLFTVEDERQFPFYRYPDSADELRDYVAAKWQHTHMDETTHARAVEMLRANAGARLWLREQVAIRTLRPARRA